MTTLLVAGCNRFTEAQLVGTWRAENEDAINEIALYGDHTFRELFTSLKEFTTPSPIEETGTWRVERNQLKLDSTVTWSKERRQLKYQLLQITKDTLHMKYLEGNGTAGTWMRLDEPSCASLSALTTQHSLREDDLIGVWQVHFHTHDYQYAFEKDHSVILSALYLGNREPFAKGSWHVMGNDLIVREKGRSDTEETETKWTFTGMGTDCFTIKDAESWSYVLKRLK